MITIDRAHCYELENFFHPKRQGQILKFIKKEPIHPDSLLLDMVHDGTTNEEVLAVLIHRITSLNEMRPCRENSIVITKLQEALMWLNERTRDRTARNVDGTREK